MLNKVYYAVPYHLTFCLTDTRRNNKEENPEAALPESGAGARPGPVPTAVQRRREDGRLTVPVPHQVCPAHADQRDVRE